MPTANIKLNMNTKSFIKALGKKGNLLQIAAAEAVNESAEEFQDDYRKRVKRGSKIRTQFTLNSIKMLRSKPISRSGEPRQLHKINSIVFVPKLKKKEHYLEKLEKGGTTRGNPKTKNKVPIPLESARTNLSDSNPVSAPNRLTKGNTQTLRASGKIIGVRGDGYNSTRKRWAVLYSARRHNKLTGNLNKPFFFIDNSGDAGIFKMIRRVVTKIRSLKDRTKKRKARLYFKKTAQSFKPERIKKNFVRIAKKKLGR